MLNSIDLAAFEEARSAIASQPEEGIVTYGVELTWQEGTRSSARALPLQIGRETLDRSFRWTIDEPEPLLGGNSAPTPQEYLMSGVGACILVGFTIHASIAGVKIHKLAVTMTGSLNLSGFLNLDPNAPIEMAEIRYKISVDADGTLEQLRAIEANAVNFSPNAMTVARGVSFGGEMEILNRFSSPTALSR